MMPKTTKASRYLSNMSYKLLVDAITDYAIYMLYPDGTIATWNAGAERAKGYKPDEIIGHNFEVFFTDDDRQAGIPKKTWKMRS